MHYEHSQSGVLALPVFVGLTILLLVAVAVSDSGAEGLISMAVFLALIGLVLLAFNRLTVTIDDQLIHARFRWGWPAKRFELADIHRVDVVQNKWWYGFGIRLTPYGWMYNVWGLDAVQLNMSEGKAFRIGTDEPEALAAALTPHVGTGSDPWA